MALDLENAGTHLQLLIMPVSLLSLDPLCWVHSAALIQGTLD